MTERKCIRCGESKVISRYEAFRTYGRGSEVFKKFEKAPSNPTHRCLNCNHKTTDPTYNRRV